jgi:hypothetical protein
MNDRIQRALDGELPADRLTPDELAEYHRYRADLCTALRPIHRLAQIDVAPEVMRRVAALSAPAWRRSLGAMLDWLWRPQALSLTLRPAFAMAALVLVALAWAATPARRAAPQPVATGDGARATRILVQFRLGDPEAREVALVGDFNGWHPRAEQRLHRMAPGVWSVEIALEPGVYNYGFLIDGKSWRLDPLAPRVTDGFGGASSRVAVLAPETRS